MARTFLDNLDGDGVKKYGLGVGQSVSWNLGLRVRDFRFYCHMTALDSKCSPVLLLIGTFSNYILHNPFPWKYFMFQNFFHLR